MAVKRVSGVSVSRPVEYGNITVPMVESDRHRDVPVDHTHKWTVFVRDPAGKDDMSYIIKKVVFKLHDTYPNSTRTIESPPYEVTETGWGEFEIGVRIFFHTAAQEKNLSFYHHLKLHPYGPDITPGGPPKPLLPGQNVTSIIYDEFVFNEPTEQFFEILLSKQGAIMQQTAQLPELPFSVQTEAQELERYNNAMEEVYSKIAKVKECINTLEASQAQ